MKQLLTKLVDFYIAPRNLGVRLISWSLALLGTLLVGGGISVAWNSDTAGEFSLTLKDGPGADIFYIALAIAVAGIILGALIAKRHDNIELKNKAISRVLVVELRGLVDTSDIPLISRVPQRLVGQRVDCLIDIRRLVAAPAPNITEAIAELSTLQRRVRQERGDTAREHTSVVAGGIMQVSLLFYVGTLFGNQGSVVLMEWNRAKSSWFELTEPDDDTRFAVSGLSDVESQASDVAIAISASYLADLSGIEHTFPGLPVVHLKVPDPKPNTLWSKEVQIALTKQFTDVLAELANQQVGMVHLVLAAPATLCIRLGGAYDHRNMPNLRCYQHERTATLPYPWSVEMRGAEQALHLQTAMPVVA